LKCNYWPRDSSTDELLSPVREPDYVQSAYALVDECTDGTHDCDENATCNDTDLSFECSCKDGWTGDGKTCAVECARVYDDSHPSLGSTGQFAVLAVGDAASLPTNVDGRVSTIFVKAECFIRTYEDANFEGQFWIWWAGADDEIFKTWEMAAVTDNVEWNDRTKSYKCECNRKFKLCSPGLMFTFKNANIVQPAITVF